MERLWAESSRVDVGSCPWDLVFLSSEGRVRETPRMTDRVEAAAGTVKRERYMLRPDVSQVPQ